MPEHRLIVDLGDGAEMAFGRNSRAKTIQHGDGFSSRTADFIFADGTRHKGLVMICDQDSGEHYGSVVYLPGANDIAEQGAGDFLAKLGKAQADVFPYRYRYHGHGTIRDHHIGDDGWSK